MKQLVPHLTFGVLLLATSILVPAQDVAPPNTPPDVVSLVLDRAVVYKTCAPGFRSDGRCDEKEQVVRVTATAHDKENHTITYAYDVKVGRIVGQGSKVYWNLVGVPAGIYTITAKADDGGGYRGLRISKEIEVKECDRCIQICDCPKLSIKTPKSSVLAGEIMTFTVFAEDDSKLNRTFEWSINLGTIIDGQGTSSIKVQTDTSMVGKNLTAAVQNNTGSVCSCENTVSETVGIVGRKDRN